MVEQHLSRLLLNNGFINVTTVMKSQPGLLDGKLSSDLNGNVVGVITGLRLGEIDHIESVLNSLVLVRRLLTLIVLVFHRWWPLHFIG